MCAPRVTRHTSILYSSSCHTRVNMGASILFTAAQTPSFSKLYIARTNGLVCRRDLCVLCTKCTLHSNHRLTVWYSNTQNDFSPDRPFSHYIHSYRLAAEMWTVMKNNLLGKKVLSCSFYLYRIRKYVSYGFPIINSCNRGVHYETPCIRVNLLVRIRSDKQYACSFWTSLLIKINRQTTSMELTPRIINVDNL